VTGICAVFFGRRSVKCWLMMKILGASFNYTTNLHTANDEYKVVTLVNVGDDNATLREVRLDGAVGTGRWSCAWHHSATRFFESRFLLRPNFNVANQSVALPLP
jgi:hypothetical protein